MEWAEPARHHTKKRYKPSCAAGGRMRRGRRARDRINVLRPCNSTTAAMTPALGEPSRLRRCGSRSLKSTSGMPFLEQGVLSKGKRPPRVSGHAARACLHTDAPYTRMHWIQLGSVVADELLSSLKQRRGSLVHAPHHSYMHFLMFLYLPRLARGASRGSSPLCMCPGTSINPPSRGRPHTSHAVRF